MPRTISKEVFQYAELSDKAKAAARDWWREASAGDNYFSEPVLEDAVTIAELFGLTIDTYSVPLVSGKTRQSPSIWWSGFCSQGDGASFDGFYRFAPNAETAVNSHASKDETLHRIARELDALQNKYGGRLSASIKHRGHYCHSGCMVVEAGLQDTDDESASAEITAGDEKDLCDALRRFADWIYRQLEEAYNYEMSDEAVAEAIEANEYEFFSDGRRCVF